MKKVIVASVLLFVSGCFLSQKSGNARMEKWNFGFAVGLNYSNYQPRHSIPASLQIKNNFGLRLGLNSEFRLANQFYLTPMVELSQNNGEIIFEGLSGEKISYDIIKPTIEIVVPIVCKFEKKKPSFYLLIGPNVKIPVKANSLNQNTFASRSDLAMDFGFGLENNISSFRFSPEFRYSIGLFNISGTPMIQKIYNHSFVLVLKFIE